MGANPMHKLSYGLFVVTSEEYEKDNGCITNTVGQVTSSPNRISVTVNKDNLTHDFIRDTGRFTVSIISESADFELFKHFGFRSGRECDKFDGFTDCRRAENGTMIVTKGTNAYLCGSVCQSYDLGTHTMFIADVTESGMIADERSATYEYYLSNIKPKPKAVGETPDGQTIWRCTICGYEYVGEELPEDFICPLCKHPASDFEKIVKGTAVPETVPAGVTPEGKTVWRCTVCGYEYEGDELPEDFVCPLCGVPASEFEKV